MLDSNVLVLNRLWQVVNVCSVKRGLSLLYQGYAQVVLKEGEAFNTFGFEDWKDLSERMAVEEDEAVKTVSFKIKIPRVILLCFYDRLPRNEVKFTRRNIFERDGNRCQFCGKKFDTKELNLDHVLPKSRGGLTTWDNIVCSCSFCNTHKGRRTLREANMHLIRKPRKPRWHPFIIVSFRKAKHESWNHFLDMAYWNVELEEEGK
ncbi:HNH endonuclease [candidate division NPL-UPA2 bacterium]|nr:HNH endonuclease [candidate division NPL-UPA2 bacterium]